VVKGGVRLTEGVVRSKRLGLAYPRVTAEVVAASNAFQLKEFSIMQPKGSLTAEGMLGSAENFLQGELRSFHVRIGIRNLRVVVQTILNSYATGLLTLETRPDSLWWAGALE